MPNPFQLPFKGAIDYFAAKTNLDTDSWKEGQGIIQLAAFTVAGAKGRMLQDLREAVDKAIAQGISIKDFAKEFNKIADSYVPKWLDSGDPDKTAKNRAWRSQLIYSQNINQAYGAGRYAQQTDPYILKRRPYWLWKHGDTRVPRPNHKEMDGAVFAAGSIDYYPPCGFNCLCRVFTLSQAEFDTRGYTQDDLARGQALADTFEPDPGFEGIPQPGITASQRAAILAGLSPNLAKAVRSRQ